MLGVRRFHKLASMFQSCDKDGQCADCTYVAQCWSEPLPSHAEFFARRVGLERGATLMKQGERSDGLCLLINGCLSVREILLNGSERIIAFRTPGELIGIEGWSAGIQPYAVTAITAATVCRLKMPSHGGGDDGLWFERLLKKTASQLRQSLALWAGQSAAERVTEFIKDFAERTSQPPAGLRLPMTRAEVGSYLGLSEETVVRMLKQMRTKEGSYPSA